MILRPSVYLSLSRIRWDADQEGDLIYRAVHHFIPLIGKLAATSHDRKTPEPGAEGGRTAGKIGVQNLSRIEARVCWLVVRDPDLPRRACRNRAFASTGIQAGRMSGNIIPRIWKFR